MQKSNMLLSNEETLCEKLLHLIEDGDADQILSAEFSTSLNELVKNDLITLEDEKVLLTTKGRQAKLLGIRGMLNPQVPVQEQTRLSDFAEDPEKSGINRSLVIILIFFLVSIVAIFALVNQ